MSDTPSESLRQRTCLICGCQTLQTINIYAPRSGPNIVKLIQAKFKFQPLNEDKYLCFSCNNWLINWHSLQALNSNDAESPSGNFRAPHLNGARHDKDASAHRQQYPIRPVAAVRPRQLLETELRARSEPTKSTTDSSHNTPAKRCSSDDFRLKNRNRNQRAAGGVAVKRKLRYSSCERASASIVRKRRAHHGHGSTAARRPKVLQTIDINIAKCRRSGKRKSQERGNHLVNTSRNPSQIHVPAEAATRRHSTQLQRPLVDGKVVAMLRRCNTTLSRVSKETGSNGAAPAALPPIMSPVKQKPHWTRPLDDDEILLDFDTAISEVVSLLPTFAAPNLTATKARVSYFR